MIMKANKKRKKLSPMQRSNYRAFYFMMAPFLLLFIVYRLFPMIWGLYISFTNYSGFNMGSMANVGWKNYIRAFEDSQAMISLGRTFLIGIITIPASMVICNVMAIALSMKFKGVGILRTIFYIPSILPAVAVGTMWNGMFLRDGGVFNELVKLFGGEPINWLGYDYIFYSLILMLLWGAGGSVLNNISAIKNISTELIESARLDGAGNWGVIRHIILPMTAPMNYMAVVTGIISTLQMFAQPLMLSGVGMSSVPLQPVYTYMVHAYQQIFANLRFGYGLALTWIVFIIMMVLTLITRRIGDKMSDNIAT